MNKAEEKNVFRRDHRTKERKKVFFSLSCVSKQVLLLFFLMAPSSLLRIYIAYVVNSTVEPHGRSVTIVTAPCGTASKILYLTQGFPFS